MNTTEQDTRLIVAERKNGAACAHKAWCCMDNADLIERISEVTSRASMAEEINTVEDALAYLDERHAQKTTIIKRSDFDELTPDSWDSVVLEQAEKLGWYEPGDNT